MATHMKSHIITRGWGQFQVVLLSKPLQAAVVIKSRNLSYSIRSKYYPRNSEANPVVIREMGGNKKEQYPQES